MIWVVIHLQKKVEVIFQLQIKMRLTSICHFQKYLGCLIFSKKIKVFLYLQQKMRSSSFTKIEVIFHLPKKMESSSIYKNWGPLTFTNKKLMLSSIYKKLRSSSNFCLLHKESNRKLLLKIWRRTQNIRGGWLAGWQTGERVGCK